MDEILEKRIANNLDVGDTADRIGGSLMSSIAFMELVTTFIQRMAGKRVAAVCVEKKMDSRLKVQILHADVKHVTPTSLSRLSCKCLEPSISPSDKDDDVKSDGRRPKHYSRSCKRHRRQGKNEKRLSNSRTWAKSEQ